MTTDFRDYFSNKISQEIERTTPVEYRPTKYDEVQAAAQNKITLLDRRISEAKQRELAEASSWVGQLGLDPDGFTAQGVNLGASLYSGASRVAGDMTAFAAADLEAMAMDGTLSEPEKQAVGRYFKGEANEFDVDLITTNKGPNKLNALQLAERAREARARGENIRGAFDRTDTVHQGRRDELSADLGEDFGSAWGQTKEGAKALFAGKDAGVGGQLGGAGDMLAGAAKLLFNAGEAAVTNPGAALEYVAENAPQLAMGMVGGAGKAALITSNLGYASGEYQKGIQKYQAENGGAYPPEAQRMEMATYAASLALAEQVGDMSLLKGAQGAVDAAKNTAKTGFLQSIKNATMAGAKGYGTEAATEGYQTFAEGQANLTPVSAEQIYEGAAIGGLVGGGLAGGGRAVGEVLKATPEHAAERQAVRVTEAARTEAIQAAIVSGDVSPLTDTANAAYSPPDAIAALAAHAAAAPDEETKQANQAKAVEIVGGLEDSLATAQANIKNTTTEGLAELKSQLETQEAKGNTAVVEALKSTIAQAEGATKADKISMEVLVRKMEERVTQARANMTRFTVEAAEVGEVDVNTLKAQALGTVPEAGVAPTPEVRTQAAKKLILKAMASRVMDPVEAETLANDTALDLTDGERAYLRQFSAAQVAFNRTKGLEHVQREVMVGGKGKTGLVQHAQRIGSALSAGDEKRTDSYMNTLRAFQASHVGKAAAVAEAWSLGTGNQVVRMKNGTWEIRDRSLPRISDKDMAINGSPTVNTEKLVVAINAEAAAITATLKELEAAYALKFNTSTTGATPNVPVVPQAPAPGEAPAGGNQEIQDPGSLVAPEGNTGAVVSGSGAAGGTESKPVPVAKKVKETKKESTSTEETSSSMQSRSKSTGNTELKESTESPEGTSVAQEVTEASPEVAKAPAPDATGGLTVFKERTENQVPEGTLLGSVYRTINKVAAFLKQKRTVVEDDSDIASQRPLVEVSNLLSLWNSGDVLPETFFTDGELTEERDPEGLRTHALNTFRKYATQWAAPIRKNFIKGSLPNSKGNVKKADQLFRDPVQDLFNEDGTMDENVVTAVAYGAFSGFVDALNNLAYKDREGILAMHGMDPDSGTVTREGQKVLKWMTSFEDTMADSLGQTIVSALGFTAQPNAPQDYLPKLRVALGMHALKLLEREGLITIERINQQVVQGYLGLESAKTETYNSYVKLVRDPETLKSTDMGRDIKDSSVGAGGIVDKLFGVPHVPVGATTTPVKYAQKYAKGTKQKISKRQAKILAAANKQEHRIIPAMWTGLQVLGDAVILKAAGFIEYDDSKIQANNREGVLAQNENLEHQLDGMKGLVERAADLAQPFFVNYEAWLNFRVGITTRDLNPQNSKIHRFMFFRPEWESKIQMDDQHKVDQFLVSIAQAFGIKVDQQPNDETLGILDKTLSDPDNRTIELAILLNKSIADPDNSLLTAQDKEAIGDMAANAEGMQTLQALVAYGKYLAALSQGDPDFTVQMLVGVDGKTNGPILSHLALGAAGSVDEMFGLMNRGGMYRADDGARSYNHWYKKATSLDLYEDLARAILRSLSEKAKTTPGMMALQVITKPLLNGDKVTSAGRSLVKTPLTSFAFGSSITKSIENMQAAFVQSVSDRIQDVANGKSKTTRLELVRSINELLRIGSDKVELLPEDAPIENLMNWEIDLNEQAAFKAAFQTLMGDPVSDTMKTYFAVFNERRNAVNQAIQSGFSVYLAIYQDLRAQELNRMMDSGEIAFTEKDGVRIPMYDLTMGQEAALRKQVEKVLPRAHTAYSQDEGDLESGLYMGQTETSLSTTEMHRVEVQMGVPFQGAKGQKSIQAFAQATIKQEVSPGVAGLPYFMHALDSYIMHLSIEGTETMNVHDEAGNGVDKVEKTAQRINGSTWSAMLAFSPAKEAFELFERSVVNAAGLKAEGTLSAEAVKAIYQVANNLLYRNKIKPRGQDPVLLALQVAKEAQYAADEMRLSTMAEMAFLDQYTWEGGEYEVTQDDRDDALARLFDHIKAGTELSAETLAAVKTLSSKDATKIETPTTITVAPLESDPVVPTSPFGELGKPRSVNLALVNFFKKSPTPSVQELLNELLLLNDGKSQYTRLLLGMLNKSVPKDLKVVLVTPETKKEDIPEPPAGKWHGFYSENTLYVLSQDFVNSGLQTPEVLLHELVHGAVASKIHAAQVNPKAHPDVAELVQDLERLMELAKKEMTPEELVTYGSAVEDVQEFVAYGMTRKTFQAVLARVQAQESKTSPWNSLVNGDGFKTFVKKVVGILFNGSTKSQQEQATSALAVLIENVTGLMAATAQPAGTARPDGRSSPLASRVMDAMQDYTTLDIHEALDGTGVSTKFDEHLRSLLGDLVHKLHGPFGAFKAGLMQQQTMSPLDVWIKALDTGMAPLALSVAASPMASTERERHAMEQIQATVKMALDTNDASTRVAHKELRDLYLEMRDVLKPSDFASQAEYDFVFAVELDANNRSDYLSRFAALTLGHEGFNKLMHRATPKTPKVKDLSFADKVQRIFERILAYFAEKMTHTYAGQPANQKLEQLVSQLVDIEAKRKLAIARKALAKDPLEGINKMAAAGAEKLRAGVSAVAKSSMVANNRIPVVKTYVQLAGKVTDLYANDRSQWLIGTLKDYSNKHFKNLSKLPMELMTQVGGVGKVLTLLQLATTLQQKHRKDMIALTTKAVLDSFVKGSKSLKKGKEAVRVKAAMTQVLMRSGAHVLMSKFNMMQFETLLDDPAKLKLAIQETKTELEQVPALKDMAVHYMHQAQALGYFRMTGDARIPKLMLNAHNIVRMYGTNMAGKITEAHAQRAEEIVSRLVALYAMSYTTVSERQAVLEVLQEENTREDKGNGIEFVLKTAKLMDDRANETIFAQQKALMIHGFMPEIYNPNTAVVTATDAESVDLIGQGYVLVHKVGMDPADPDKTPRSLYALRDGGQARYQSAIMANTGMRTKGSPEHSGFLSPNSEAGMENLELNREIAAGKPTGLASGPLPDLTKPGTTFMVPVVNPKGTIVNWRYMMKDSTKDTILERDNRIEAVLGVLAGSIFDKQTTTETNIKTLKTLKELYESDKTLKSSNYVLVGPDVEDPELAEIWSMLPDDTKEVARRISGRTGIHIAKDMLMPVFGYRKYSLAESFRKSPEMRNIVERMMVPLIESFLTLYGRYQARRGGKPFTEQQAKAYAKRAAVLVTRGERGWNEIVKEIKDIVVIKSITVTVDNILSNISQLVLAGVPLKDILFNSMVALRGATAYELDSDELEQLELKVANGMTQGYPTIHADIARLKDSLARNPIRELIDSGLMPTIVEDVEADDNPYSYKSALVRGTEKYVNKLNPHIVNGLKTIYGTHDTKLYKGLNRIARLSDFAARYAMYQYETTRKENKVAKDDAIFNASESFINYDTPLPRAIQYVDDMGIIPFLKYYLRIQRVLLKLARENPGRVLGTLLLNNLVSLGPIVLESSWMHRIGNNPFQWGAVAYPGKIDDLPYIAAGLALVK